MTPVCLNDGGIKMSKKNFNKFNTYENKDDKNAVKKSADEEVLEMAKDLSDKETIEKIEENKDRLEVREVQNVEAELPKPTKGTVIDGNLNVREEPSTDSEVMSVLQNGTEVTFFEDSEDNGFVYVTAEPAPGLIFQGWCMKKFIKID